MAAKLVSPLSPSQETIQLLQALVQGRHLVQLHQVVYPDKLPVSVVLVQELAALQLLVALVQPRFVSSRRPSKRCASKTTRLIKKETSTSRSCATSRCFYRVDLWKLAPAMT